VLSGRGFWEGLIARLGWCVGCVGCDGAVSIMGRPWPTTSCQAMVLKKWKIIIESIT